MDRALKGQAVPPPARDPGVRLAMLPPLALYVHIPWCVRKCPYCDFNSHALREGDQEATQRQYVQALIADLEAALPAVWGRRVVSVFFGGGTPSLFSPRALDDILSAVRARLPLSPTAEITLEANPGTVETGRFGEFRALGINRLSLGVQSFHPAHLSALGRIHDGVQARRAAEIARAHFDNFNLDLMYALPGQDLSQALADVDTALAFAPPHLSCYHLTLEPNTVFAKYPPPLPDEDAAADMQEAIESRLGDAGYDNYETSAFARPGSRCAHNLNYWSFGDYLGLGAGAHGKLSHADRITREVRYRAPDDYVRHALEDTALAQRDEVDGRDLPFEFMMNALRLTEGFETRLFEAHTGLPASRVLAALDGAERDGLLVRDLTRVVPTLKGRRFLNDLLQRFLP